MQLEMTGSVVENEPGVQTYFREEFRESPAFPFDPGDEFRAIGVPGTDMLVLVEADRDLEFPIELIIRDPESYRVTIERDPNTDTP
ncbi:hypothetical protein [Natrinema pallidum]|uniref:Uncharacterized protein n=1 Tax=Natrinema pallidum TaxID=69527 RepID=A0A4P9TMF3_9EURY|nr:hypothetical protein [Natrinema pallidum]QCW05240.1 hypothetical protein FGF80_18500 [Natrinema pallidum]